MDPNFELRGPRLRLRPMRPADITPQHVGWLNDPQVVRHSNLRFLHHTRYTCRSYLGRFEGSGDLYLSVRLQETDRAVGTLSACRQLHHGTADMGILMGERSVWGQGLGGEAFLLLADWLAQQPGMRKLGCSTLSVHHGMLKIAERAGFKREAVRVAQELLEGEPADIVHLARFTPEAPPGLA